MQGYVRINGIYDSGITPVSLNEKGEIPKQGGLFGVEANVGAYGSHEWKRKTLGLEYNGGYRHYGIVPACRYFLSDMTLAAPG